MKLIPLCLLSILISESSSFVILNPATPSVSQMRMAQVDLEPEPAGGEELTTSVNMEGTRMKKMGEAEGIKNEDGTVYQFWMKSVANEAIIKKNKETLLKDAKKKAEFPGFRKGVVPPFAMGQIVNFAIQEAIIQTVEQTVTAYKLKSIAGNDGQVDIKEDITAMCKGYKPGTSLEFTATINCVFDPDEIVSEDKDDGVITVEATPVEE